MSPAPDREVHFSVPDSSPARPRRRHGRHRRRPVRRSTPTPLVVATSALAMAAVGGLSIPSAAGNDAAATVPLPLPVAAALDPEGAGERRAADPERDRLRALEQQRRADAAAVEAQRVHRAEVATEARRVAVAAALRAAEERATRERARPRFAEPVADYRLSARFGQAGSAWSSGRHTGLDFAAPTGTPVRAASDGEITFAGRDGAYGTKVELRHPDGTVTWYAHLSRVTRDGGTVRAGEDIGAVGSTGNSSGPHLHFEVHLPGGGVADPAAWLRERGVRL